MFQAGARAPLVAVALPSRSAYFLLDDFNHHHQHAVLAGQSHRSGECVQFPEGVRVGVS